MPTLRQYGHVGRTILQVVLNLRLCTEESFAAYLSSVGAPVDRSMVALWATGGTHVPVDVIVHLARHTGQPVQVLGVLAREVGCEIVEIPAGMATGRDLVSTTLGLGGVLGRLQAELANALDPSSDGGATLTDRERELLAKGASELRQRAVAFDRLLQGKSAPRHHSAGQAHLFEGASNR